MVCELRIGVVGGGIEAMGCSCCWRRRILESEVSSCAKEMMPECLTFASLK